MLSNGKNHVIILFLIRLSIIHLYSGVDHDWSIHKSGSVVQVNSSFSAQKSILECKNGSNCNQTGDLICDTPPDYGYGLYSSVCTEPNIKIIDPCGDEIKISNNNYMGSFASCTGYVYSPMQLSVMEKDLLSPKRATLFSNNSIPSTTVDQATNLLLPTDNATTAFANTVTLDWSDVPNANYIIEISKISNFSQKITFLASKSELAVNGLLANTNYYWRVLSFHPLFGTCNTNKTMSKTQKFKTSALLADKELSTTNHIQIFPNPILLHQNINIVLNSKEMTTMEYEIFTIQGQKVAQNKVALQQGDNTFSIPNQFFTSGIYILKMDNQAFRFVVE